MTRSVTNAREKYNESWSSLSGSLPEISAPRVRWYRNTSSVHLQRRVKSRRKAHVITELSRERPIECVTLRNDASRRPGKTRPRIPTAGISHLVCVRDILPTFFFSSPCNHHLWEDMPITIAVKYTASKYTHYIMSLNDCVIRDPRTQMHEP